MNNFRKTVLAVAILSSSMSNVSNAYTKNSYLNSISSIGVVARDLNVGLFSGLGHVGISYGSNTSPYYDNKLSGVIEVLNEKKVIQANKINDFKSMAKYWGNKKIFTEREVIESEESLSVFLQIYDNGCTQYTSSSIYSPTVVEFYHSNGTIYKISKCGSYRCDTFVLYSLHLMGLDLPSYRPPEFMNTYIITPEIVWNEIKKPIDTSLKHQKQDLSLIKAHEFSEKLKRAFSNRSKLPSIDKVTEKELNNMPLENFMVIVNSINSKIQIKTVKNLLIFLKGNTLEDQRKIYLIDTLAFAADQSIIPDLIDMYKSDEKKSDMFKNQILGTIQHISQDHLFDGKHPNELKKVRMFYRDLLSGNPSDKEREISSRGIKNFETLEEIKKNGYIKVETVYPNPLFDSIKELNNKT